MHVEFTTIICGEIRLWYVELVAGATRIQHSLFQSRNPEHNADVARQVAMLLASDLGVTLQYLVVDRDSPHG